MSVWRVLERVEIAGVGIEGTGDRMEGAGVSVEGTGGCWCHCGWYWK